MSELTAAQARPRRGAVVRLSSQQGELTAAQARPRREPKAMVRFSSQQDPQHQHKRRRHASKGAQPAAAVSDVVDQEIELCAEFIHLKMEWNVLIVAPPFRLPRQIIGCTSGCLSTWWNRADSLLAVYSSSPMHAEWHRLRAAWAAMSDVDKQRYVTLARAQGQVLLNSDLLMGIFSQIPNLTFSAWEQHGRAALRVYANCALVCKNWNAVLHGRQSGLERDSQELFKKLLASVSTPHWIYQGRPNIPFTGVMTRGAFCNALALSTARANALAPSLPKFLDTDGSTEVFNCHIFPMPAAFNAALASEGGWSALLKRRASRAKRTMEFEKRTAQRLVNQQSDKLAKLKMELARLSGIGVVPSNAEPSELGDAAFWSSVNRLGEICKELTHVQGKRRHLALQRGAGHRSSALTYMERMGAEHKAADQANAAEQAVVVVEDEQEEDEEGEEGEEDEEDEVDEEEEESEEGSDDED
jgi:hypothetical protein